MKKRMVSLLLAATMLAALAGCGDGAAQNSSPAPSDSSSPAVSDNQPADASEPPQSGEVSNAEDLAALANSVTVNPNAGRVSTRAPLSRAPSPSSAPPWT